MNRSYARVLFLAVVLLASLMFIPSVRAAVLDFIQVGIVRIFRSEPTAVPQTNPAHWDAGHRDFCTHPSLLTSPPGTNVR